MLNDVTENLLKKYRDGKPLRHARAVELGEAERRFAEFAVLLLGVGQPFHQAILMNMLNTAATFARTE
jgi:hypothetical protein